MVANDLVDPFISTHRAAEVRLLAACCLSDIFKIYVPQPPFQDKQCKQVFHNFIDHLHGLRDPASPSIPRCQYLLENLAKVNTFLYVCVDENMDENILQKLFELSFLILKQNRYL